MRQAPIGAMLSGARIGGYFRMSDTSVNLMSKAIGSWMATLEQHTGWKEHRRKRFSHTLYYDDPFFTKDPPRDFVFPKEIEAQHDVIMTYLGVSQTLGVLKQTEYYFRNYPFRNQEVSKFDHLTNICEMYFSRFYEMKERLKKHFNALKVAAPQYNIEAGPFIKQFERAFDSEIRARNGIHHHGRFEDLALDRIFLTESIAASRKDTGWRREHNADYRRLSKEWAERVRQSGIRLDAFIEELARATLATCDFLRET